MEALGLDFVGRAGYRLQYATKPSELVTDRERDGKFVTANDSLGLSFTDEGKVTTVVPGMPGDKAGVAPGMTAVGVNERKFSGQRLKDAIADSVTRRKIDLLVLEGDKFRAIAVSYADGPKYLELVRDASKPDILKNILKPLVSAEAKP